MGNIFITKHHRKNSYVSIALQKMELALNISLQQKIYSPKTGKNTLDNNMITFLCCVPENFTCNVIAVKGKNRTRFSELGINPGVSIKVEKVVGNLMQINLREFSLALRKEEAQFIKVSLK